MINNYSYPKEFKALINKLERYNDINLLELDGIGKQLDVNEFSKLFFNKKKTQVTADVSVDSNSNVEDLTLLQYIGEMSKPVHRLNSYFLLWKYSRQLFSNDFAEQAIIAQLKKDIYINDFHSLQLAYCFNFTCIDVVFRGLPFTSKVISEPPKNLSSFMGQMINFITYAGNNIAGACGVADLLVCMSWYVKKLRDKNTHIPSKFLDKHITQEIQSFIYSVNQPFRGGIQSFFTNVSLFDEAFLDKIHQEYSFPDGSHPDKNIVKELQVIYIDLMNEVLEKSPATFPVTTAAFGVDENGKILDEEFLTLVAKKNMKYGFMNIYAGKTSTFSSCCRLRSEGDNEYFNSFGSGGTKIGSLGVVTINLPRLAYKFKDTGEFLQKVGDLTELASKINHVKRFIIKKRIDGNHYPLYALGFMTLNKQYSTCGIIGVNEAITILGLDVLKPDGQQMVMDILDTINYTNDIQSKKYDTPHNTEQVPAENCISGETIIKTIEGDKKIRDLIGKEIPVFSFDRNTRKPIIKLAKNIRKVLKNSEIYRVWFDNKTYIDCTANHRFAKNFRPEGKCKGIFDIKWIRCDKLKKHDSIRFLDRQEKKRIYYNGVLEEHLVYRFYNGNIPSGYEIHHKDRNKQNNKSSNLECLTKKIHRQLHYAEDHDKNTCKCSACKARRGEYTGKNNFFYGRHHLEETKKIISKKVSKTMMGRKFSLETKEKLSISAKNKPEEKTSNWNKNIKTEDVLQDYYKCLTYSEIAKKYNCTTGLIQARLKKCSLNHKIAKIEKLSYLEDVYDLEVEDTHCFFAGDGVLIHNSAIKLAKADRLLGYNKEYEIYSNQFIPLTTEADFLDRIKLQGMFDKHMTGGAICHLNILDQVTDYKFMKSLIKKAIELGVVYFAVNYNLQKCTEGHITVGKDKKCPTCGKEITDNYTRVVGFLVNVKNFNVIRREKDYPNRQWYDKNSKISISDI